MGHAFVDNMRHYGDPDFVPSPVAGLASPEFAASRAASIRLDRAAPRPIPPGDPWPYQRELPVAAAIATRPSASGLSGTSQMVAADADGNVVALITSLTSAFGSLVLVPDGGFFLNNAMRNFDPRPDRANCIAPGKMPIFAVPAIAAERDGVAFFGAGVPAATGSRAAFFTPSSTTSTSACASSRPSTVHVCTARARRRTSTAASQRQCRSNFVSSDTSSCNRVRRRHRPTSPASALSHATRQRANFPPVRVRHGAQQPQASEASSSDDPRT